MMTRRSAAKLSNNGCSPSVTLLTPTPSKLAGYSNPQLPSAYASNKSAQVSEERAYGGAGRLQSLNSRVSIYGANRLLSISGGKDFSHTLMHN